MAYIRAVINERLVLGCYISYSVRVIFFLSLAFVLNQTEKIPFSSFCCWLLLVDIFYRCFDLTEKLDHSSSVALIGFALILAVLRTFNVKTEASRVMIGAPLLAFLTTHILYLNFYKLDHGECSSLTRSSLIVRSLHLLMHGEEESVCLINGGYIFRDSRVLQCNTASIKVFPETLGFW